MSEIILRPAVPADGRTCGRILHEAFKIVAERHGEPPDFPSADHGFLAAAPLIADPAIYGVVAEIDGQVVGCSFMDERDPILGTGPAAVDPAFQGRGVGRMMIHDALERGRNAIGMRGVCDPSDMKTLTLYTMVDWAIKEPLVLLTGKPKSLPPTDVEARRLQYEDMDGCTDLCRRVHGFPRTNQLRGTLWIPICLPYVILREGRVTAYASAANYYYLNHGVAETEEDMRALLLAAGAEDELSFLLPTRHTSLLRWCLGEGLKAVKPRTLMVSGAYQEPRGFWIPSVIY